MAGQPGLDLSWITDDLAVGGAVAARAGARLADEGVGCVIDMREEACDDAAELAAAGLGFLHLPVTDHHAPAQDQLDVGVRFAEAAREARQRLLIHCEYGIGRSPTLALCVLVHRGVEPLAALAAAKDVRELVSPSPAQYTAWVEWIRRRAPTAGLPGFEAFKAIAYRHLPIGG
jgi:protein tyrosine phosphatase (PTP) superfamily phosphohydrolase (DUF442 family)